MQRFAWAGATLLGTLLAAEAGSATTYINKPQYHLIPGEVYLDSRGPDGNTVILDAPEGLIVVDTGRHPAHSRAILDYANSQLVKRIDAAKPVARPVAAIVNTHWHLDHTTGNHDIRQAHPGAQVYATNAIEGALVGFLGRGRAQTDKILADPKTPADQKAQLLRGRSVIDNPDRLRPTRPVTKSGRMKIAGRKLDVHVAKFAATEADLWLYDRRSRTAIVGDLVVDIVPFMDTACPDGWAKALNEVAATPFVTLIPGHGAPMNRAQFLQWKGAFNAFVECGRSSRKAADCVAAWKADAAPFIDAAHADYAGEAAAYYIDTRLRSSPEEQAKYCKSLRA